MSFPGDGEHADASTDGDPVIRLAFRRRAMSANGHPRLPPSPPFTLMAADGRWSLHREQSRMPVEELAAEELAALADTLREIARNLADQVAAAAGQPARRCIAEFVLYDDGGIDHWVAPTENDQPGRTRLKLGLRTALSSIRDHEPHR